MPTPKGLTPDQIREALQEMIELIDWKIPRASTEERPFGRSVHWD